MIYIPICFTLLVLIASLYFLAKFKKEGLGGIFIWGSYLIMLAAVLILLCQFARGVIMMRHHFRQPAGMSRYDGMRGGMMWRHGGGGMDRGCCDGSGMMKCDGDKMMCDKDKMKDGKDSVAACCKGKKEMKERPEKPEQPEKQEKPEKQ